MKLRGERVLAGACPRGQQRTADRVLISMALWVASCCLPALMLHTGGYVYEKDLAQAGGGMVRIPAWCGIAVHPNSGDWQLTFGSKALIW